MAIAKGRESQEAREIKRYVGVAPVFIAAVNPDKKQHEELFNTTLEDAPNYLSKVDDGNGGEIPSARIQLVLRPDEEKIGFPMPLIPFAFFIQNRPTVGSNSGKTQIIDKYGRTAWATAEELEAKAIPVYKNGKPADIDKDYRPAYVGEEDLMKFVKAYLCIPSITVWDDNQKAFVPNTNVKPEECECRFENLDKLFKGDFSEVMEALAFQPTNKVKVLLGVRTSPKDGKQYQDVYKGRFLNNAATNYSSLDKEVQDMVNNALANGRSVNTYYEVCPVHEYVVEPTTFTPNEGEDDGDNNFQPTDKAPWEA